MNLPPELTPSGEQPSTRDQEHLKSLALWHAINAPFSLLGGGSCITVGLLLFVMSLHFTTNPNPGEVSPRPDWMFAMAKWGIYGSLVLLHVVAAVMNLVSALLIKKRRGRLFSLATACLNCLQIPQGTVLGIATLKVLTRPSVRATYARAQASTAT